MSVKYALRPHTLDNDPDSHVAAIVAGDAMTINHVIDEMISRGSTVTRAEALAVLEEYSLAVKALLCRGHRVNTPLLNLRLSIKGLFDDEEAVFEPGKHQVRVTISPGVLLRDVGGLVTLERVNVGRTVPEPLRFRDVESGTLNDIVTPGELARLAGLRLQYNEGDSAQGIFFVDAAGTGTRVTKIVRNKPSELNFLVPAGLAPGAYTLEVRAELFDTGIPRTGLLPHTLTVQ